jgi:hypothetical protein
MIHLSSYAKVFQLGHPQIANIFDDVVLIEEKIDGSQFCFGFIDGEFVCRSHNKQIDWQTGNIDNMFKLAFDVAYSRAKDIDNNTIYRCEYLQKPKHNSLTYSRTPKDNLIVFDIEIGLTPLSYKDKKQEADRLGLECVPLLYQGLIKSVDELLKYLDTVSILGGVNIEGVVVKNYNKYSDDKKYYVGKYVSEQFKEKHRKEWGESNPSRKDIIEQLCDELRTEARWNKAIQHLREDGKLLNDTKDIGILLKEIQDDIKAEETDYIKDKLFSFAIKQIERSSVRGFPEYYKKYLLENSMS